MIGSFKNKIVITKYAPPTQTSGGGLVPGAAIASMAKWAAVKKKSGSLQVDSMQREWNDDYEIKVRYTKSFVESSSDVIVFDEKTLVIRSVSFEDEGAKRLVVLRCSTNE